MLRTKAVLTCDSCGKVIEEEGYTLDYDDARSLIARSNFTQYDEYGRRCGSSMMNKRNKTLCAECAAAYEKASASLAHGFMGGAE